MLSGVQIICFAASYAVAWALEVSRLLFRSGIRGAAMLGFVGAGWIAHSTFLYYRAVKTDGAPLSSTRDWYLLAAWVLVVVYVYLACYHPKTHFGVFLLPLVLGLIATAAFCADPTPFAREPASKIWGTIHATAILLATVSVLVGFAAGLMYLGQARWLKRKHPRPGTLRLPSLEWLQEANGRALIIAMLMLGLGVLSGIILNLIGRRLHAPPLPWNDPVVLATIAMFLWLLLHAVLHAVYRPIRQGRKVAYLTIASFIFLVIALTMGLLVSTQHGRLRNADERPAYGTPIDKLSAGRHCRLVPQRLVPAGVAPIAPLSGCQGHGTESGNGRHCGAGRAPFSMAAAPGKSLGGGAPIRVAPIPLVPHGTPIAELSGLPIAIGLTALRRPGGRA